MFSRLAGILIVAILAGCSCSSQPEEVIVYCALDQEFSEPILQEFEQETGIRVRAKYDIESTKTVGLVNAILQERARPRCDLFWNNEILHTIRLDQEALLRPFEPAAAKAGETVAVFSSPIGTYYGLAARARVLIVNTELVPEEKIPTSVRDLVDPQWKGQVAIAKPLFGTTATHAAVLWNSWGEDEAKAFFEKLKDNAKVLSGNKQVAQDVGRGALSFGLTDTDDAIIELESGRPVRIIFPDQAKEEMGTVFIPNTICLLMSSPKSAAARKLADKILSRETEAKLAACPSAQIPILRPFAGEERVRSRVEPATDVRFAEVDFASAAKSWEAASKFLMELFTQ
jgi:iron(III) transport system substrate-binding protein